MTRQELITKATEDPEFREQLKGDPRGTVERAFGIQLAEQVEVTVLEETPKHAYIVLPVQPSEVSPEQLDAVSGGAGLVFTSDPGCGGGSVGWTVYPTCSGGFC